MIEHDVITHIHTEASCGEASVLDPVISGALRQVIGPDYDGRWQECINTPEQLAGELAPAGPVKILFMTDHVNEKSHRLNPRAISVATKDPRIGLGVEILTWHRDEDGNIVRAPEILIYGRADQCRGREGSRFGITQEDLDILFDECSLDDAGKADIRLVRDYCILNGYAHALAHPFDGSELTLPRLLDIITDFKFVETVNGGFPADSSVRLSSFVSWYNKAADGLLPAGDARSDLLNKMHAKALETGPIHPLGGSDAHARNHDRVVVRYKSPKKMPTAGDFISDMVRLSPRELLAGRIFSIDGAPATKISLLDDVVTIAYRNILSHRDLYKNRSQLFEVIAKTREITARELMDRRVRRKELIRNFDETIRVDIMTSLAKARKKLRRKKKKETPAKGPPLPERVP